MKDRYQESGVLSHQRMEADVQATVVLGETLPRGLLDELAQL